MHVLSDATIHRIRAMARDGYPDREIATALGISQPTAGKYADYFRRGGEPPPPKVGRTHLIRYEKREAIRLLVRKGASQRQIARLVGITVATARNWIQEYRGEGPNCQHGKNLYGCARCVGGVRRLRDGVMTVKHGKGEEKPVSLDDRS